MVHSMNGRASGSNIDSTLHSELRLENPETVYQCDSHVISLPGVGVVVVWCR